MDRLLPAARPAQLTIALLSLLFAGCHLVASHLSTDRSRDASAPPVIDAGERDGSAPHRDGATWLSDSDSASQRLDGDMADDGSFDSGCSDASADALPYRIVVPHGKVSGTVDLMHFPLLVHISNDPRLATRANGGGVALPTGEDIYFEDVNGVRLDHEIDTYDGIQGTLACWVRVPVLRHNADTQLTLRFGDPGISPRNPQDVWDTHYRMVHHMGDAVSSSTLTTDSTRHKNDGTKRSVDRPALHQAGRIGAAQQFAEKDYLRLPTAGWRWVPGVEARTLSFWFRPTQLPVATGNPFQFLIARSSGNQYQFVLATNAGEFTLQVFIGDRSWRPVGYIWASWAPQLGRWYHIAMVAGTPGNNAIYIDGQAQTQTVGESNWGVDKTPIVPTTLGIKDPNGSSSGQGVLDEVRFSHITRSAAWIRTTFDNMSDPGTFAVVSPGACP